MKEKKAIQEAFTELSSHYEEVVDGELNLFWGWSYDTFLQELVNQTTILENQKILDIATGTLVIPRKILEQQIPGIQISGPILLNPCSGRVKKNSCRGKTIRHRPDLCRRHGTALLR